MVTKKKNPGKKKTEHLTHVRSELAELNIALDFNKSTGHYSVYPINVSVEKLKQKLTVKRNNLYNAWEAGKEMAGAMVDAYVDHLESRY